MKLKCRTCLREYSDDNKIWQCECGGLLDIIGRNSFDPNKINKTDNSIWRYHQFLPVSSNAIISLGEGMTPIIQETGNLFFKLDYISPTGSFKDRGASVLVSKMKELGIREALEDSSGNAGKAIAAYCGKADIECQIVVPQSTSDSKITNIKNTGANVKIIDGNREKAALEARKLAEYKFYASHCWNPYFLQGTKTIAYEIYEQLQELPDRIIVPVGNGTLILGIYIGLMDLKDSRLIDKIPEIMGTQANLCAPLVNHYRASNNTINSEDYSTTLASGICVARPIRGKQILEYINKFDGKLVAISEDEIFESFNILQKKGYIIEPTAAVGYAAYRQCFNDQKTTLIILTGRN